MAFHILLILSEGVDGDHTECGRRKRCTLDNVMVNWLMGNVGSIRLSIEYQPKARFGDLAGYLMNEQAGPAEITHNLTVHQVLYFNIILLDFHGEIWIVSYIYVSIHLKIIIVNLSDWLKEIIHASGFRIDILLEPHFHHLLPHDLPLRVFFKSLIMSSLPLRSSGRLLHTYIRAPPLCSPLASTTSLPSRQPASSQEQRRHKASTVERHTGEYDQTPAFQSPFKNAESNPTTKIPSFKNYMSKRGETSNKTFQYFMVGSMGLLAAAGAKATVQGELMPTSRR